MGVVSPMDEAASVEGRGTRLTLRTAGGQVLSDLIIGKRVEDRDGNYYYVRRPDSKRVYATEIDADRLSVRFADWVETDLLKLSGKDIEELVFNNYSIDEQTMTVTPGEKLAVKKSDDPEWVYEGALAENESLDVDRVKKAKSTLDNLRLVGVRRKPEGLMDALDKAKQGQQINLVEELKLSGMTEKGFYLAHVADGKYQLMSNEGELVVRCEDGVVYRLRFGEVVYGAADDLSSIAGDTPTDTPQAVQPDAAAGSEHRYLLVTAEFDPNLVDKPVKPEEPKAEQEPAADDKPAGDEQVPTDQAAAADDKPDEAKDGTDAAADEAIDRPDPAEQYKKDMEQYEKDMKAYDEKVKKGRERVADLAKRFDDWYYVISADAFGKLHLTRTDLVTVKEPEKPEEDAVDDTSADEPTTPDAPLEEGGSDGE